MPRAPEGRKGEVKEDQGHAGGDEKFRVVGALGVIHAGNPGEAGEDYDKKEEEDAGNFKPENSADAAEGLKEAANTAAEAARSPAGYFAGGAGCGLRGGLIGRGRAPAAMLWPAMRPAMRRPMPSVRPMF